MHVCSAHCGKVKGLFAQILRSVQTTPTSRTHTPKDTPTHLHGQGVELVQPIPCRLYFSRSDGAQEVLRGHVDLRLFPSLLQPDGGKVAEDLVGCAVRSYPVFVLDDSSVMEANSLLLLFSPFFLKTKVKIQKKMYTYIQWIYHT